VAWSELQRAKTGPSGKLDIPRQFRLASAGSTVSGLRFLWAGNTTTRYPQGMMDPLTVPKLLHPDTWVIWEAKRHARQGRPKQVKMLGLGQCGIAYGLPDTWPVLCTAPDRWPMLPWHCHPVGSHCSVDHTALRRLAACNHLRCFQYRQVPVYAVSVTHLYPSCSGRSGLS